MTRKVYEVRAYRSGNWWAIEVPDVPGVFSQARRIDQVAAQATDALATFLDVAPDSFSVLVRVDVPEGVADEVAAVAGAKAALVAAQEAVGEANRAAVERLVQEHGLSYRDAAWVLGVSPGRIAQIANSA